MDLTETTGWTPGRWRYKLSILIPSLKDRAEQLSKMEKEIEKQVHEAGYANDVEIIALIDNGENPTGEKRQWLLAKANSEYIVFVDDDDELSHDYISSIMEALQSSPDVVGFKYQLTIDNRKSGIAIASNRYEAWMRMGDVTMWTPMHTSPVKRRLALEAGFPAQYYREDWEYARRLKLLLKDKTEVFIDKILYVYNRSDSANHKALYIAKDEGHANVT